MDWFNYKIVIGSQEKLDININPHQINSWCINYNQYTQNKIPPSPFKNKLKSEIFNDKKSL